MPPCVTSEFHPLQYGAECPSAATQPPMVCAHCRTASRATLVLHAVTLALLAVLVGGGAMIYAEVRRDIATMKQPHYWINALLPDPANVPPAVVNVAAATMGGAFDQWFLGAVNGTIAGFAQRVATADFASLGKEVAQISATLMAAVGSSCQQSQTVTCPTGGELLQCANGNVVYCEYAGQIQNCGSSCGISASLYEPASVVQSVAAAVADLSPVPRSNATATDPAFSSGPFALSVLLQWLRAQTAVGPWVGAAQSCVALADNVMANDWSGVTKDWSGSASGWNANQQVQSTAQSVRSVCAAIANMTVS